MIEYHLIRLHYGEQRAERSGVPYINHIDEGLLILDAIYATSLAKRAFCLHPLLQSDEAFIKHKAALPKKCIDAVILAMEYRRVANSYLSNMSMATLAKITCEEIRQMLIADKVQNYKDFMIYNEDTHPRAKELNVYFNNWFRILDIKYEDYAHLI